MAQNTTVSIPAATWTQLTDADVTNITFQNIGSSLIFIKATTDATPPTNLSGAFRYSFGQGERNVALTDLFPGLSGGDRVWCYSEIATSVVVSHA